MHNIKIIVQSLKSTTMKKIIISFLLLLFALAINPVPSIGGGDYCVGNHGTCKIYGETFDGYTKQSWSFKQLK
jgi:hypothetical protein